MSESTLSLPPPFPAPTLTDAVQLLRLATQELHHQLDQNLPIGRDDATLSDYAEHLRVIRDWQLALQPWLSRTSSSLESLELIDKDLAECIADLRVPPRRMSLAMEPVRRVDDGSLAFCWGVAYVLEGSRLGGQVLYRRLRGRLAPHPLRYFGEPQGRGLSWPDTLKKLRAELATSDAQSSACQGAVAAFALLLAQFQQAELI